MVARPTFRIQPFEDPIPNPGARSQPHHSSPTHPRATAPATRHLPSQSTTGPGIPSVSSSSLNPANISQSGKLTGNIGNAASSAAGPASSGPQPSAAGNSITSNGNGVKATGAGAGLSSPLKGAGASAGGGIAAAATAGLGLAAGGSAAHSPAAMAALRRGAARFWTAYSMQLAERPLLTKCATGVVGTILGDFIAQLSSHAMATSPAASSSSAPSSHAGAKDGVAAGSTSFAAGAGQDAYSGDKNSAAKKQTSFKYDYMRMLRLCIWSVAVGTPLGHYWFQFLDTRIMPHAPTSNAAVVAKLLLDQLLMSPAGTALFFFGFKLLEGGTVREARTSVYDKWGPTMALNVLWPAANIVNFKYVPPEQRILYCNCVALLWSAVMSHMATRKPVAPTTIAAPTTATIPATAYAAVGGDTSYGVALAGGGRAGSGVVREREREHHHRGDRDKGLAPAPAGAGVAH